MGGRRALDAYSTEERLTRALLDRVQVRGLVLEPCAGANRMADVLMHYPGIGQITTVMTNDIDPAYTQDHWHNEDATDPNAAIWAMRPDWVVTNPPFGVAMPILENAFRAAKVGVAFLLRWTFQEPVQERAEWLEVHRRQLSDLLIFGSPRPSFTDDGRTDATTVAWMVWRHDWSGGTNMDYVTARPRAGVV